MERVRAGLARAKAQGTKLGRPSKRPTPYALDSVAHLSTRAAALKLGISNRLSLSEAVRETRNARGEKGRECPVIPATARFNVLPEKQVILGQPLRGRIGT